MTPAINIFLSWSGKTSLGVAEALRSWLPKVIQAVDPWLSTSDIEQGCRWSDEVTQKLQQTSVGIICLTRDNLVSPWILFEAGALSKLRDQSFVCTYLHELSPSDVSGPLAMFQATRADRNDTRKLIHTINRRFGTDGLSAEILNETFDLWWPKLDAALTNSGSPGLEPLPPVRSDREIIEETLSLVREVTIRRGGTNANKVFTLIGGFSELPTEVRAKILYIAKRAATTGLSFFPGKRIPKVASAIQEAALDLGFRIPEREALRDASQIVNDERRAAAAALAESRNAEARARSTPEDVCDGEPTLRAAVGSVDCDASDETEHGKSSETTDL